MHRRSLVILAVIAVLVVAGVSVGLVEAWAQGEPQLPSISPAQLLANVAEHADDVAAISGDVSWKNDLLGLSMLSFGGLGGGDLSALLSSGSGRIWVQGGKARIEIQGMAGDTSIVGSGESVWRARKNARKRLPRRRRLRIDRSMTHPTSVWQNVWKSAPYEGAWEVCGAYLRASSPVLLPGAGGRGRGVTGGGRGRTP